MCYLSRIEFQNIYKLLKIDFRLQERGESFYNPFLEKVVQDLLDKKIATESEGAVCFFQSNFPDQSSTTKQNNKKKESSNDKHSNESVLMIRKSDGGYLYGTTDIAAVYHRFTILTFLLSYFYYFYYFNFKNIDVLLKKQIV